MAGKIAYTCGKMPWTKETAPIKYPALTEETKTDVLIIGGGLSGLMTAYFLTEAGVECLVTEKGAIGGGASRFFAGYSCDEVSLSRLFGLYQRKDALTLWQNISESMEQTAILAAEVAPGCRQKQKDCFLFTQREENLPEMEEEFRLRNFSGFPCEMVGKNEALNLFSFPVSGGVYTKNGGGEIHPEALCDGIAARITLKGNRIAEESEISSVIKKEDRFVCKTKNGSLITANAVCDCRGIELLKRYPVLGKKKTLFGICSAPAPNLSGWPARCVMRNDEKRRPLLLFGAEQERAALFGEESGKIGPGGGFCGIETDFFAEYKYELLKAAAEETFLGQPLTFPFCGAAGFIQTKDRLPYAGEDKALPGYFYLCPGGINTVPFALLCGKTIAESYTGQKKNPLLAAR